MRFYSNIFFTILCCWPSWFSCSQGFSSVIHQFSSHFCIRYFFLSSPKFRVLWRWKNRDDYPVPIPYRIPSDCDWFGSLSWDKSFASLFYVLCYFDPVIYFIHLQINRCDLTLCLHFFESLRKCIVIHPNPPPLWQYWFLLPSTSRKCKMILQFIHDLWLEY